MRALMADRSRRCGAGLRPTAAEAQERVMPGRRARHNRHRPRLSSPVRCKPSRSGAMRMPDTPQPAQTQAVRERNRPSYDAVARQSAVATRQAGKRQASNPPSDGACVEREAVEPRAPAIRAGASVERAAAVREVIVSPAGPPRTSLSAGFNEYITRMNIWSRPPWEIPATLGGTVPGGIQVYGVPAEIVAIDPAFAGAQFVVIGDDVVILEPDSRRIVAMLSRTSGAYVAERMAASSTTVSTTGVALPEDRVRLSRAEVAAIRTVLRHRECRYRRRSDFFVGDVVPGTAPLCEFPGAGDRGGAGHRGLPLRHTPQRGRGGRSGQRSGRQRDPLASPAQLARLFHVAGAGEPVDRLDQSVAVGPRRIAELAARLRVVEVHVVARHAKPIDGGERLAAGEAGGEFRTIGKRVERGARQPHQRRPAADDPGDLGQHLAQRHVLAAEDIALADLAVSQRREMALGRRRRHGRS